MPTVRVFINYRRDTDGARAALLEKGIEGSINRPGTNTIARVHRDVRERYGLEWDQQIKDAVEEADIVVAVIGPDWLDAHDLQNRRRIDQDDDWVRLELDLSLQRKKRLIPLFFDGAAIPKAEELPATLAMLPLMRGLDVRTNYFDSDVQPLLNEILHYQAGGSPAGRCHTPIPHCRSHRQPSQSTTFTPL